MENKRDEPMLTGYIVEIFNDYLRHQKKNWDFVIIIDGIEGSGKSKLARQLAYFCDNSFLGKDALDRICFDPEDFKNKLQDDKYRGKAVVFDEAFRGLASRGTMTSINKELTTMLMECRQRNMFIFLVLPSFFELDKYAAVNRSICLIHVYVGDDWQRGHFSFYDAGKLKFMYGNRKNRMVYNYGEKPNFVGSFSNTFDPVDEELYNKKKSDALKGVLNEEKKEHYLTRLYRERFKRVIENLGKDGYERKHIAVLFDMEYGTFCSFAKEIAVNNPPANRSVFTHSKEEKKPKKAPYDINRSNLPSIKKKLAEMNSKLKSEAEMGSDLKTKAEIKSDENETIHESMP